MGIDRDRKILELFERAIDLPEAERTDFLREASRGDEALIEEVRQLLLADANYPENAPVATPLAHFTPASLVGQAIGPYTIRSEIGHGGMGTVYLATREDVQSRVALKLLHGGRLASRELIERFLLERRVLARLRHPNIALLLDAGVTPDGMPYYAMEFVDGMPITEHCDSGRLTVRERLRLFQDVCSAVHYAHRNLVVHRDLKPNNIFVDREGGVKLLDFGIARLLEQDDPQAGGLTRTGVRLMTPRYASPEQMRGDPVTTASDVYSMGVVLYELVAGEPPFATETGNLAEFERHVSETNPRLPSSRVREAGPTAAIARGTEPAKLRRQLRGDLDTIVLMALRKEPERRYTSVERLRDDIERYLTDLPVTARRDTLAYRGRKFVRRNRTVVAAAVLLFAVLVGFGLRQRVLRAEAERARDAARVEAGKAARVSDFLVDLFELADPAVTRGEEITAREILERGETRVEDELKEDPEVQATMMSVLGRVYTNLGLYPQARTMLEGALERRREAHGPRRAGVAGSLVDLARLSYREGNYERSGSLAAEAVDLLRETGGDEMQLADGLEQMAIAETRLRDYAAAERRQHEAIEIRRRHLGPSHPDLIASLDRLATLYVYQDKHDEAAPLLENVLEARRKLLGEPHPDVASTLDRLGAVEFQRGEFARAEAHYLEALDQRRRVFGPEHPEVAASLNKLGVLARRTGKLDVAEGYLREALDMRERLLGDDHPDVAVTLSNLGGLLEDRSPDDAERMFRRALTIERAVFGEYHHHVAYDVYSLAKFLEKRGRLEEAEPMFRELLDIERRIEPEPSAGVATTLAEIGKIRLRRGDAGGAEPLLREALSMLRETEPDDDLIGEIEAALRECGAASADHDDTSRSF